MFSIHLLFLHYDKEIELLVIIQNVWKNNADKPLLKMHLHQNSMNAICKAGEGRDGRKVGGIFEGS